MYGQKAEVGYGIVTPVARDTEVPSALSRLDDELGELERVICALDVRLASVLNPKEQSDGGIPSPDYSCELARRISGASVRARILSSGVSAILARLEV